MRRRDFMTGLTATATATAAGAAPNVFDPVARPFVADGFNGVAVAGVGDRRLWTGVYGLADAERGVPLTARSRFETGSVSKWIAAVVVLKLAEAGRLSLDEPLTRLLPDYRADTGAKLTLRRLMSHSSGVPNAIIAARKADPAVRDQELEQMEAVKRYASGDLAFEPGAAWDYSHSNWLIVKAVAERASGLSYGALVQRTLVRPLGLRDSGVFRGDSAATPGMAVGYGALSPAPVRKPSPIPDFMAMAGGFYASAPDMLTVMQAVLDGRVLSVGSRQALTTVLMPDQHYALGGRTRIETIGGRSRETAWQDGSNGGFRMVARQVLADGRGVVVMSNASFDYQKLGDLASALMEQLYSADAQA